MTEFPEYFNHLPVIQTLSKGRYDRHQLVVLGDFIYANRWNLANIKP